MSRPATSLLAIALAALAAGGVRAGEVRLSARPFLSGGIGFHYRVWNLKKEGSPDLRVYEAAAPVRGDKPIGARGNLAVRFAGARASSEGEDESRIGGATDALLSASFRFDGERYRIGILAGLPTGKATVEAGEETAAAIAMNRMLRFPVKRFGEGFDWGVGATRAFTPGSGLALSVGAGYLRKGAYPFFRGSSGDVKYRPGSETFLEAGVERERSLGSVRLRLDGDLRYRFFEADERNGEKYFEEGDQIELVTAAALRFAGEKRLEIGLHFVFKGAGSEEGAFGDESLDSLSLARFLQASLTGDYREIAVSYLHPVTARLSLLSLVLFESFGEYPPSAGAGEERLLGSASIWEAGGGFRYALSSHYEFEFRAAGMSGKGEGGGVDLSGYDLVTALEWVYR